MTTAAPPHFWLSASWASTTASSNSAHDNSTPYGSCPPRSSNAGDDHRRIFARRNRIPGRHEARGAVDHATAAYMTETLYGPDGTTPTSRPMSQAATIKASDTGSSSAIPGAPRARRKSSAETGAWRRKHARSGAHRSTSATNGEAAAEQRVIDRSFKDNFAGRIIRWEGEGYRKVWARLRVCALAPSLPPPWRQSPCR